MQALEEGTIPGEVFIRFGILTPEDAVSFQPHISQASSGPGWGTSFAEPDEGKDEDEVTTAEAEEEYKRVFAECLENNFDLELATKTAKAAMRAALNIVDSEDEESEGDADEDDAEMEDLTRGITVIQPPRYSS